MYMTGDIKTQFVSTVGGWGSFHSRAKFDSLHEFFPLPIYPRNNAMRKYVSNAGSLHLKN